MNVFLRRLFVVGGVSLVLIIHVCAAFTTVLDTVQGGAQAGQSYVYQSIYSPANDTGYYGNVEFRGGISMPPVDNSKIALSVTPPTSSTFISSQKASWIYLVESNITLGKVDFATTYPVDIPNQDYAYFVFRWSYNRSGTFTGAVTPYGIFLTDDITIRAGVVVGLYGQNGNGFLEGNNHKMIIKPGGGFFPAGQSGTMTIKNLTVLNAENLQIGSAATTCFFQNVTLNSSANQPSQNVFRQDNSSILFRGINKLTGGGTFSFVHDPASYLTIASNSQLYIGPQTTINFGAMLASNIPSTITFTDATSVLFLDNCNVTIDASSIPQGGSGTVTDYIQFLKGTVYINGTVTLKTYKWSYVGGNLVTYLQLGDGVNAANNCNLIMLPGSKLVVSDGKNGSNLPFGSILVNSNV